MNVFLDNVNTDSNSGPNSFAKRLIEGLSQLEIDARTEITSEFIPDIQLSFIMSRIKYAPLIQRLDGIYFNTDQDYESLNKPIKETYENSEAVVFQTDFNRDLITKYFGNHWNYKVIRNGTNIELINSIERSSHTIFDKFEKVWCCASSWRPHKRLSENIRYFLEFAPDTHCLIVLGPNPDAVVKHHRIFYGGNIEWRDLISIYKRSDYFIHLAWLDHCPNVVVDARACGCKIVCSSSGGTKEISGKDSKLIYEDDWDFSPINLYKPPKLDFSKTVENKYDIDISIQRASKEYSSLFRSMLRK